ncbi:hypothetical protein WOLCODRAFT_157490 [Wolfiporia cocos MD-104 SS10]|uniref:F-box domain-containing protein n=1 Tax=Wolfiporia cocos (strain MD-104) TaxID=742152 RepID=A0A2H3JAG2_WOLCO|nr:hypothetical protein WOLCODRAFT_157490 [Wolfiporia cocos MD-104 SS10]
MCLIISGLQERLIKKKTAKANTAKRRSQDVFAAPVREDDQDHVDTVNAAEKTRNGQQVRSDSFLALQEEAQDLRGGEEIMRGKSAAKSGVDGEDVPRRENMLKRAWEANEIRKPGWIHIGRVPGAPDLALAASNSLSRRPPQLPTEICERIIDWQWEYAWMLQGCALVCKAWTPRCRYWMQRIVVLRDRKDVQGYARRAREQPDILHQGRSVWVAGGVGERAPIPQLGTLAMMGAGKLPFVWRLCMQDAIWKPSDFHPLIFVHLSAFSSVTALRLADVTFPKVREFGSLVCALPSLVRLTCENVLFTSTAPCASLAITRCPPSVRLTDLVIFSDDETSCNVEANKALLEHLCAAGVVADLQRFEFCAWASFESKYLDTYKEPIHELFKQCSQSLRYLKLSPDLREGKDLQTATVSDTIASVFDLAHCDSLETIGFQACNFEKIGYAWMHGTLRSSVSRKLREVSIVMCQPVYSQNAEENLQRTMSALKRDICPQLDELFSHKDHERLHLVDFVYFTAPDEAIPDATRWEFLLEAEMPKLHEQGVLRTRVDVFLTLFNEDFF